MRKLSLIVCLLALCSIVKADPVDVAKAAKVAERLMNKKVYEVAPGAEVRGRMTVAPFDAPAFHVFEASDGKGFALVSGDDEFPEIIGYSDKGGFAYDNLPDGLMAYLEMYSQYVAEVRKGNAEAPQVTERITRATPVVAPMCEAQWGQGAPFYNKCPLIGVSRCVVGCVATAMAQIMYYHKFPERASGLVSYDTENPQIGKGGILTVNLNTTTHIYDWVSMKNTAGECTTVASRDAVAQLSYDCGVTAHMSYGTDGSGTTDVEACYALYTNFGYSKATVEYKYKDFFDDATEWEEMIIRELDEKRPVLFGAVSSTGGGADAAGHAFVLDGYDSNGFVHVNWGWDGYCDGYYDIVKLNPDGYTFSLGQDAIVGIKPGKNGEKRPQSRLLTIYDGVLDVEEETVNVGEKFVAYLPEFYNFDAATHTWYIGAGLYDKYGNFIQKINLMDEAALVKPNFGSDSYYVRCTVPATLADGDYAIRMIINEEGYTNALGGKDWILPYCVGGDSKNWYPVMVQNGVMYFGQVSTGIEDVNNADAQAVVRSEYFDLNGRTVANPRKGSVIIEKQTLRNGKHRSLKRLF